MVDFALIEVVAREMMMVVYKLSEEEGCGHTRWELSGDPITSQEEACPELRRGKSI